MASAYPTGLDTLATNKQRSTVSGAGGTQGDHADHHNDVADAVNKIEAELGVNPSGGSATVKDRLDTVDAAVATNVSGIAANAAAITVLQKRIVSVVVALPGTALATGEGQGVFAVPAEMNGLSLVEAVAIVSTPAASGTVTVGVTRQRGASSVEVLSTLLTIDATEYSSTTAATPDAINNSNKGAQTDDLWIVDVDVTGTGSKGLVVLLKFA